MQLIGRHASQEELRDFAGPFSEKDGAPKWTPELIAECVKAGAESFPDIIPVPKKEAE